MDNRTSPPHRRFGRHDIVAGLSVAVLLIPQSLAYAEIAGFPAYVGLYAAALPPIVAAIFASSRYLQTGPVALTSLLTFGAVAGLAEVGSDEYLRLAMLLAIVVGVVRLAMGLLKLGDLAYFMSQPVLMGFTTAAAILIISSQIPNGVGFSPGSANPLASAADALSSIGSWNTADLIATLVTIGVIVVGRRISRHFPTVLVVAIAALLFTEFFEFTGAVVGEIPAGLPPFALDFPWASLPSLIVPGIVIAFVGFADAIAIARTYAIQDRERWDPDRELVSQGLANLASGLSCAFPIGGSFSRSSLDRISGGRTRWAGAVTGLAVLAFLPFAGVIQGLPRGVLAGLVIAAMIPLLRPQRLFTLINQSWGQSVVAWGTLIATLGLSPRIDLGVVIGVGLAVLIHLRRERNIRVRTDRTGDTLVLQPSGVLFFGSAVRLNETLDEEIDVRPNVRFIEVNLTRLGRIDYTGALALQRFIDEVRAGGIAIEVTNIPDHALGTLRRSWGDAFDTNVPGHEGLPNDQ